MFCNILHVVLTLQCTWSNDGHVYACNGEIIKKHITSSQFNNKSK